jgi:hypothetical protein
MFPPEAVSVYGEGGEGGEADRPNPGSEAPTNDFRRTAFVDLFDPHDPVPLAGGLVEIGVGQTYAPAK